MATIYTPKTQEFLTDFSDQAIKMMMSTKLMGCKIDKGPVDTPAIIFYAIPSEDNPETEEVGVVELDPDDGSPSDHVFDWLINIYQQVTVAPIWAGLICDVVAHEGGNDEQEAAKKMQEVKNRYPGKNLQEIYNENPLESSLTEALSTIIFDSYGNFATNFTSYKYSDIGTPVFDFQKSKFVGSMFGEKAESYLNQKLTSQIMAFIVSLEVAENTKSNEK